METGKIIKRPPVDSTIIDSIKAELNAMEHDMVEIDGRKFKPSQCYRFGVNPVHILFNTNCPGELKQKVNAILNRYFPQYESSAPQ